jgi:dTDP-4-dehydrorhamnose reductase
MKILITGSNGLLGQHLIQMLLTTTNYTVLATGKGACRTSFAHKNFRYISLDITNGMAVHDCLINELPDVIIHAAAATQPDPCELDKVACWLVNVTATRFLVDAATMIGAYFLYVSTDFVFDGKNGPYTEEDRTEPVNYYGSSKLAAELAVQASNLPWAIVRTVLVFGNIIEGTRTNIVSWVKHSLENKQPIKVVSDQIRTPTYVEDLAKGILLAVQQKATGIFHISGEDIMSPYDMAIATANYLHLDTTLITKVDAATFSQPAQRPLKTGFIILKAKKELNYQPLHFTAALLKMLG